MLLTLRYIHLLSSCVEITGFRHKTECSDKCFVGDGQSSAEKRGTPNQKKKQTKKKQKTKRKQKEREKKLFQYQEVRCFILSLYSVSQVLQSRLILSLWFFPPPFTRTFISSQPSHKKKKKMIESQNPRCIHWDSQNNPLSLPLVMGDIFQLAPSPLR